VQPTLRGWYANLNNHLRSGKNERETIIATIADIELP
jgi:hypothetical protein